MARLRRPGSGETRGRKAGRRTVERPRCKNAARMIDRDQVLHVARLARLSLEPDEVERIAGELSGVLKHVDRITALDLEGVPPTDHVVELKNVLREDRPRPSLSAAQALANAPDPDQDTFRVPSPQA